MNKFHSMHDYADKSWLQNRNARSATESTVEKVAAVLGLVFVVGFVIGLMLLPLANS